MVTAETAVTAVRANADRRMFAVDAADVSIAELAIAVPAIAAAAIAEVVIAAAAIAVPANSRESILS